MGIIDCEMHIGDEVFVHGYIDEIRNGTIIIRNVGGYFGTSKDEVFYYEKNGYGTMNAVRKTEPIKTTDYCDICKRDMCDVCIADATNPYCVPSHYEINYEPKDESQTNSKITRNSLRSDCTGCRFIGWYDTEFPCVNCVRKNKDYYDSE